MAPRKRQMRPAKMAKLAITVTEFTVVAVSVSELVSCGAVAGHWQTVVVEAKPCDMCFVAELHMRALNAGGLNDTGKDLPPSYSLSLIFSAAET